MTNEIFLIILNTNKALHFMSYNGNMG